MDQRLEKLTTSVLEQRTALPLQNVIQPEVKQRTVLPRQKHSIQKLKQRTVLLLVTLIALMAFVELVVMSHVFGWAWTGFQKNDTVWDWLQLLIVPIVVGVGAIWFTTQPRWRVAWTVVLGIVLAGFIVMLVGGYFFGWTWTGFRVKDKGDTLWNWISMLLVPLIVLAAAKWFSTHQSEVSDTMGKHQQTDLQLAHERQQEVVLEAYLNHMTDLLLHKNLSRSQPGSDVCTLARALTLTALHMVGKNRKRVVLQFLHDAGLITQNKTIIDLRRGNLREADLNGADLREADLSGADLSGANLSGANLSGARLIECKVTAEQLATALSLNGATMFNGSTDVELTLLRRLPSATVSSQLIAATPIQPAIFKPKSDSAMCAHPRPAPTKSIRLAKRRLGPAPHWIVLLLGLVCILIAGSLAFATVALLRTQATPYTARTNAHATVIAPVITYNAVAANGIMDGFDAQHTRVNPYEKIITPATVSRLQLAWQAPTGGKIGSAATVANNEVYISSSGKQMFAFRATTGAIVWHANIGSLDFGNAPTYANDVVYMGAPDHYLYAYNASTGKFLWKAPTGGRIGSSPTLANDVIYIGSDDGRLYAFDASTGKWFWQYQTGYYIRSSPAVANGIVYVGSEDSKLYAIDASTGTKLWQYSTKGKIDSSPAVVNGIVYVGSFDGNLYAIDASTGTKLWQYSTKGKIDSSPAVYKGVVYVGSQDGKLYALDAVNGRPLWTAPTEGSIRSSPTIADGVLFIGSDDGSLYAYAVVGCRSASCLPLWSYLTGGKVVSSPVVANGYVYVGSDDGYLYAFDIAGREGEGEHIAIGIK